MTFNPNFLLHAHHKDPVDAWCHRLILSSLYATGMKSHSAWVLRALGSDSPEVFISWETLDVGGRKKGSGGFDKTFLKPVMPKLKLKLSVVSAPLVYGMQQRVGILRP